jgi:hypothetical protein
MGKKLIKWYCFVFVSDMILATGEQLAQCFLPSPEFFYSSFLELFASSNIRYCWIFEGLTLKLIA